MNYCKYNDTTTGYKDNGILFGIIKKKQNMSRTLIKIVSTEMIGGKINKAHVFWVYGSISSGSLWRYALMDGEERFEKGDNYVLNTLIHISLQDKINELLDEDKIPNNGINDFFLIHKDVIVPSDERIPNFESLTKEQRECILGSEREAGKNIFKPLRYCSPGDCLNISTPSREPTTVDEILIKSK